MSSIASQVAVESHPVPLPPEIAENLREEEAWLEEQEALLVTEDDEPVDSLFSELQMRLLVDTLYTGWSPPPNKKFPNGGRSFWAACNVGVFATPGRPAIVPDAFLSIDRERPESSRYKSYFCWRLGKPPEVVIEIVSGTEGNELESKKQDYEQMRVPYYVVFDPFQYLRQDVLQVFAMHELRYEQIEQAHFPDLGLGLRLWHGVYEKAEGTFLRWVDREGNLLPTSKELAERAIERAEREAKRAKREAGRAKREAGRAEREAEARGHAEARLAALAAKLRELGLDPDQV